MLTDRGPSPQLRADEIDVEWLRGSDVLHVSGYALLDGAIAEAGARAAGAARAQGAQISVDLASARGIAAFGPAKLPARSNTSSRTSSSRASASSRRWDASLPPQRSS